MLEVTQLADETKLVGKALRVGDCNKIKEDRNKTK